MTAGSIAAPTIIPLKVSLGPKHVIDSATKIELASDTTETVIYYTLDKSRPTPTQKHGRNKTYRYHEPFTLSVGKVTIKALACSHDMSKESSVVTKNFTVLKAENHTTDSSDDETGAHVEYESPSQPPSISAQLRQRLSMSSRTSMLSSGGVAWGPDPPPPQLETSPTALRQSQSAPLVGSCRSLKQASTKSLGSVMSVGQSTAVSVAASNSRPATAQIPQPVCLYCKCPRPKDSSHQFCSHCGSQLPPLPHMASTPPLQVAVCTNCRAHVPLESSSCVVCEHTVLQPSPIPIIQAQAHTHHMLNVKLVCLVCGTRNRPDSTHCWTCEKPLPPDPAMPSSPTPAPPPLPNSATMRPISGSSYMMCGLCGRVNVSDARFCDWCGSKPAGSQLMVECAGCQTANEWHSRYCYSCGAIIRAPLRPEVELSSSMKMPADVEVDKNAWIPVVEMADRGPETQSCSTQTDGIFYPSARTIGDKKGSEFIKKMINVASRDRLPKLHTFSPGKGLWRVQVEHICTHFRAHCQTCDSFQSSLGKPQLGKLLSAEIQDKDNEKVNIHLIFALKQHLSSSSVLRRASSCGNISSASTKTTPTTQSAQTTPTKKPPGPAPLPAVSKSRQRHHRQSHSSHNKRNLSGATKKLYRELSQSGLGRRDVVNTLVQQGADVNAVSADGRGLPMLSLAAANGHTDCIATLVESGALTDAQTKATGNTALHEAVLKGPVSIPCIEALLGQGADAKRRNGAGLTPCDLAMKLKHDEIVTCLATYVGAGLLDQLYKYQPSLTL